MSFKQEEFLSYLLHKRKRNAAVYCNHLHRIEQEFKLDIDAEYLRDRFDTLNQALKTKSNEYRRVDRRSFLTIRQMKYVLRKYGNFLKVMKYAKSVYPPVRKNPTDIYSDLSVKDVMVGTVRDGVQLRFILKNKCYYVPADFISEDMLPIRYIALHEQGIGSDPGIRRYGEVLTAQTLKRKKISVPMSRNNAEELYYYFKVRCWADLPRPITIRDTSRGKPLFTNKFLLDNCTHSYQLFSIESAEDLGLMKVINLALEDMRGSDDEEYSYSYPINDIYTLVLSDSCFAIINDNNKTLDKISVGSFLYRPREGFNRMKKIINK